ncbi:MAG: hypothetical protein WCG25_06995 [bacterium]
MSTICLIYCTAFHTPVTIVSALEKNKAKEIPNIKTITYFGNTFLLVNGL